jgi:hypothetical protein
MIHFLNNISDTSHEEGVTGEPPVVLVGSVDWYKQKAAFLP